MLEYRRGPRAAVHASKELISVCCGCKRTKDPISLEPNAYTNVFFVSAGPNQSVTHGICNECIHLYYPDVADEVIDRLKDEM